MKIAFWSHEKGMAGTTTNMAIVTVMLALGYNRRSILLENHYNCYNLEKVLFSAEKSSFLREEGYYYQQKSVDYLIRHMGTSISAEKLVKTVSLSLLHDHLRYIPQGTIMNKEVFAYQLQQMCYPLMNFLEHQSELVGVDVEASGNASTSLILEESDLVVVSLSQNPNSLYKFLENYGHLQKKAVFIIGNYKGEGNYSLEHMLKEFPHINKNRIGIIPYDWEVADAVKQGRLIGFLARNYQCGNFQKNYPLIRECKNCASMINRHLHPAY